MCTQKHIEEEPKPIENGVIGGSTDEEIFKQEAITMEWSLQQPNQWW